MSSDESIKAETDALRPARPKTGRSGVIPAIAGVVLSYFLLEVFAYLQLKPGDGMGLAFGAVWAILLSAGVLVLPRKAGRVAYGISYALLLGWTMGQTGYFQTFDKLMWLTDLRFAGEGAVFVGDVIGNFSLLWWLGSGILIAIGVILVVFWPGGTRRFGWIAACAVAVAGAVVGLNLLPQVLFARDNTIWGTHSEFAQSSSYRATYNTMYSARSVYDICGIYQLTFRDFWKHEIYPRTPEYQAEQKKNGQVVDAFFAERGEAEENEMTGRFAGKNVVLVLMESMDDWLITQEDTPTLMRLMEEGIHFTNFYTPFYGGARTLNTEFCANSGIFLPTNGDYVFDYVTNQFNQSMANQFVDSGYTAEVFHYNEPSFYSRGVFEPALGYHRYNTYEDYTDEKDDLYNDCFLFENQQLKELFFREGQTFNFIITRSAHLSYVYNEVLSDYALRQYPEYRGKYGHEEVDCARAKARLVDDLFARLLEELESHGQLENTVIIGITDHYTYGFEDVETMMQLSGVSSELELERTPCFIWSADGPNLEVEKTLNTLDLLPTVLNLMGIDSPYHYLGQDAFDSGYVGYALFADGSWIYDGIMWHPDWDGETKSTTATNRTLTAEKMEEISALQMQYAKISNLLLTMDYYKTIR